MVTKALLIGVSTIVLSAAGLAADPDVTKLPAPAAQKDITYAKDVKPILEKSCFNCHGPEKPKSKYRLDIREDAIKGGSSKEAAVIPGKSEKSPMVLMTAGLIEEMEMPPLDKRDKYPALKPEQIGLLRAWIDQGAK